MSKSIVEIQGFNELQQLVKKLPDSVKRRELLKVLRRVAKPTLETVKTLAPGKIGTALNTFTGTKGSNKENAVVYVGKKFKRRAAPGNLAKYDPWYWKIVEEGHDLVKGGRKRNNGRVVGYVEGRQFMTRGYNITKGKVTAESEVAVTKYIQRQINRLSNV